MLGSLKDILNNTVSLEESEVQLADGELKLKTIEGTDGTVTTDTAETAEAELKVEDVQDDIQTVVEATTAMESYIAILRTAQEDGGLNAQAGAILRVAMERFETLFGLEEPLSPSVEAFGGSMSQRRATDIALESLEVMVDKAKRLHAKLEQQLLSIGK